MYTLTKDIHLGAKSGKIEAEDFEKKKLTGVHYCRDNAEVRAGLVAPPPAQLEVIYDVRGTFLISRVGGSLKARFALFLCLILAICFYSAKGSHV